MIENKEYDKYIYEKSDIRIKENISDSDIDKSHEAIMNINIKDYNYINDIKKTKHKGIIAQELIKIIPNAVHICEVDEYHDLHTIEYREVISYLIQSIQKLNEKIEHLDKQIILLSSI